MKKRLHPVDTRKPSWGFRQYWGWVLLLGTAHFASDFYNNFLPPLLPLLVDKLHLSLAAGGLLVMIYAITSSMLQPVCGYWVDRQGSTWPLLATIPGSAFFICLSGEMSSPLFLFLTVAVAGAASSIFHPLASAMIARVTAPTHRAFSMSLFVAGGNLGFGLAPALLTGYLAQWGLERLLWLGAPALALSLLCLASRLQTVPLASRNSLPQAPADTAWYRSRSLLCLNAAMALRSWTQVAFLTFLPLLLPAWKVSAATSGTVLTAYLLGGAAGGFCGGWAGDRWGHSRCITVTLLVALPSLAVFLWLGTLSPLAWGAIVLAGAGLQGSMPSSIVWAQEMLPQNAAMASGMMLGLTFGLGGVGTALTGALGDLLGLPAALAITLLPLLAALLLIRQIPLTAR